MVGIFSRFSTGRNGHRKSHSAVDVRRPLSHNMEAENSIHATASNGIETSVEFRSVEHPTEPINFDEPVKCPLPEPSILNDGRIWKERMSSVSSRIRNDLPVLKEGSQYEPESSSFKPRSNPSKSAISPSLSAPEHDLLNLLDECHASQFQNIRYKN